MPSISAWIDIPSLGAARPDAIGYGELPGARAVEGGMQMDIAILAPDRLALYPGPAGGEPQWRCVTTPLRRTAPGGFLVGASWETGRCEVAIDGALAASSDTSLDIPTLPIGGTTPPDHSANWAERAEAARKLRRRDFNASDLCFDAAGCEALFARLAGLTETLRRGEASPAAGLAGLIGAGRNRAVLQRAAGALNAALPVFGPFGPGRTALALPTLELETEAAMPGLSAARDALHPTAIDLDDWLALRAWIVEGALHDNAAVLAALAGGAEADPGLRRLVAALPPLRRAALDAWAAGLAEAIVALAENLPGRRGN
jgi:hypothetical protein